MVLKTIFAGCGVRASLMLFLFFALLCKSINTELNANGISLYTLYSVT